MIDDIISQIGVIIPLIIAFGISIIPMPLIKEILGARGNKISLEISLVVSLVLFIVTQIALGIFALHWTLLMLLLLTPIMLFEAFKPTGRSGSLSNMPKLLTTGDGYEDILCFSTGRNFSAIAALSIPYISTEETKSDPKDEEFAELKWLYPFWEDGKKSHVTITMETTVEEGLSILRFFVTGEDKDWKKTVDKVRHARLILETWLTRKDYDCNVIESNDLSDAYSELSYDVMTPTRVKTVTKAGNTFVGVLLVEKIPKSLSSNLGDLLQQLLRMKVKGRVLVSFRAGTIPRLPKNPAEVRVDPQHQPRIPHRVEEHNLRKTSQLMAEIEACEETGSFNIGISLLVIENTIEEVENTLAQTNAAVSGILGGVNVTASTTSNVLRSWQNYALRKLSHGKTPISGARLTALLNLPEALPGTPSIALSPEFALPSVFSVSNSIKLGTILLKGKETSQVYEIPTNFFSHDTAIFGNPGSGKTNTAFQLVNQHHKKGIPFLVIVPAKKEWRAIGTFIPDIRIFTACDIRFNFLDVPIGVSISTHIANISTCFIAAWPSEGILTEHISKVFRRAYVRAGWNLFTNERGKTILVTDLYEAMLEVANDLKYGQKLKQDFIGALSARFETLIDDPMLSVMFNTERGLTIEELLNNRTILELNDLPDTHKALVTSLIMVCVAEHLEANSTSSGHSLQNLLVLEEAHHVLKRVASGSINEAHSVQQHAIDTLVQLLRESRGLGLGLILIDQLPGHLAVEAVKLPGITIIHTLFDASERILVGGHANLTDEQLLHIGSMKCGEAVIHQAFAGRAVNVKVDYFEMDPDPTAPPWTDARVASHMEGFYSVNPHLRVTILPESNLWVPDDTILWNLKSIIDTPEFMKIYKDQLEAGQEFADACLRNVLSQLITDSSELARYFGLLSKYIDTKLEPSSHFAPIERDSDFGGDMID